MTPELLRSRAAPVIRGLLATALEAVARNDPGRPQGDDGASYARLLEPEFSVVDWSSPAATIHHQVRTFRYIGAGRGPVARVDGRWLKVLRTRLTDGDGLRVECADGPIWITESAPGEPPKQTAEHP